MHVALVELTCSRKVDGRIALIAHCRTKHLTNAFNCIAQSCHTSNGWYSLMSRFEQLAMCVREWHLYLLCERSSEMRPVFFLRKVAMTPPEARVILFEAKLKYASDVLLAMLGRRIASPASPRSVEDRIFAPQKPSQAKPSQAKPSQASNEHVSITVRVDATSVVGGVRGDAKCCSD